MTFRHSAFYKKKGAEIGVGMRLIFVAVFSLLAWVQAATAD